MAVIVNDRDVLLKAADPRIVNVTLPTGIIIPGYTGIEIDASPTTFFSVATDGTASPATITLTAVLKGVSGVVTWSVESGGATLSVPLGGANLTRLLHASNMAANQVYVRASVVDTRSGILYEARLAISKAIPGIRGTVFATRSISTPPTGASYWDAGEAIAAITAITGSSTLRIGDAVTLQYQDTWVATRAYVGGDPYNINSWATVEQLVNGNLLVRGTVIANAMAANSVTFENAALANAAVTSAKIKDEIGSDDWYATAGGTGWVIQRTGNAYFNGKLTVDRIDIRRRPVVAYGWHDPVIVIEGTQEVVTLTGGGKDGAYYETRSEQPLPAGYTIAQDVPAAVMSGVYDLATMNLTNNQPWMVQAAPEQNTSGVRNWSGASGTTFALAVHAEVVPVQSWSNNGNYANNGQLFIRFKVICHIISGSFNSFRFPPILWALYRI